MRDILEQNVAAAAKELFDVAVRAELTRPEEQFGDYATNVTDQAGRLSRRDQASGSCFGRLGRRRLSAGCR